MADKEPSQRQLRVGQEIKKIIAHQIERDEIIEELVRSYLKNNGETK